MPKINRIEIFVNPEITPDQLWDFYVRNHICEEGYGKDLACRPLRHSSLIVGAFEDDKLIGISRAMFDGLSASIMEFSLDLEYQGNKIAYRNGSLIGNDIEGIGLKMGKILLDELDKMGAFFISYSVLRNYEELFFQLLGFESHGDAISYVIDKRPYLGDKKYVTRRNSEL